MKEQAQALEHASVRQYCKALRVPVIGAQLRPAGGAGREGEAQPHRLSGSIAGDGERRARPARDPARIHDARLPRMKTLEEFDFNQAPQIPAAKIRELAEGGYIERAEPVVLMGECGTGKTHLATGLCVAACRQKRRVRFTTAANLVNELVEASQHNARATRAGALDALRPDRAGRSRLCAAGRDRRGVFVPGDRRTGRDEPR